MSVLERITPVILTHNEEPNIGRVLERLLWARRVVIVDSASIDGTERIARSFRNTDWFERPFDSHEEQWNFAVERTGVDTEWVLTLDADYVLTPELLVEMARLEPSGATSGYSARFAFLVDGVMIPGSLYPERVVLWRRGRGRHFQTGHTQRLQLDGPIESFRALIQHDDRKPWTYWRQSQRRYALLEARWLIERSWGKLRWQDRVRRTGLVAPWLVPLLCLVKNGLGLSGRAGWKYLRMRAIAELEIAAAIWRRRLHSDEM